MPRKHEQSLRAIFHRYALGDGAIGDALRSKDLLDYPEWLLFLGDIDIFDSQFTQRDGAMIFTWSRMRVVDEVRAPYGPPRIPTDPACALWMR